jgi:integrase
MAGSSVDIRRKVMSTAVSRAPKKVSPRTLQRIEALRLAIPPVYQAASETAPLPADEVTDVQYEFAWSSPDIAETPTEPKHFPGTPWNRGRIVGAKLPLKPKHVWSLRFHLHREHRGRDLALFDLAIDSKLRGCDLIKLRTGDLILDGQPKLRATVIQQKTGKPVTFELTEQTRESLLAWLKLRGGCLEDFVFPSRTDPTAHISTRQYARLVDEWMVAINLNPAFYGTHSMRRTKVALIYKKTGNLRAVQILLGHTKLESTVRYLGVDIDDALSLSEAVDL